MPLSLSLSHTLTHTPTPIFREGRDIGTWLFKKSTEIKAPKKFILVLLFPCSIPFFIPLRNNNEVAPSSS